MNIIFNNAARACFLGAAWLTGCSDDASSTSAATADGGGASFDSGVELRVPVAESARVYVKLSTPAVVAAPADPKTSAEWDLAFEGHDIFTNGGVSGAAKGAMFGPLEASSFLGDTAPAVPFLFTDKAGGAFLDWYAYAGAPTHALYSRFHVFGVKDGDRLWKVQILNYYGQRDGAPVSGLYAVRYAEVLPSSVGPTTDVETLDGTAGGPSGGEDATSECLDLASGQRTMLTPAAAQTSNGWHLCFRRTAITVNGGIAGGRGVVAVDLDAAQTAAETVGAVQTRTPASELARFDAANAGAFANAAFRTDRVVSGFGDAWLDRSSGAIAPANAAWLVVDASGTRKFLLGFTKLEGVTNTTSGTVVMRVKPVGG